MKRRDLLVAAAALGMSAPNWAQNYPSKAVRLVVPYAPGGGLDVFNRPMSIKLAELMGQSVVIENRAGASGVIGADVVAKSAPDGHTLLWGIDTTHTINPHIYKVMPFKDADLKPLVVISSSGLLLGVHPGTGIKTVKEFMQAARERSLNFSSGGNGSPGHLWVNMANVSAATRLVHIPYRGNSPAVMAVVSGEVQGGTLATPGMLPQVKGGKINALAVTSQKRSRLAPEVPTVTEAGFKDLESEVLYVVMAPGSTPEPLMQTMAKAITDALARPELQTRLNDLDMAYEGLTGTAAVLRLSKLSDQYGRVIRATGMKVD